MDLYKIIFKACFCNLLLLSANSLSAGDERVLDCISTFKWDLSDDSLIEKYGIDNVTFDDIYLSEGEYQKGTILYKNTPGLSVKILWKDNIKKANPSSIEIDGKRSYWRTPEGITLGTDLLTLEKINKSPFILAGFGWDFSGRIYSWENGALDSIGEKCKLVISLSPNYDLEKLQDKELHSQVSGDRDFSSDNAAMKALNPRAYSIYLVY